MVDALDVVGACIDIGCHICVIDALVIIDVLGTSGGVVCMLGDLGASIIDVLNASDVLGVVVAF